MYNLLRHGLDAPICLTWELTHDCNLRCGYCLSSSSRAAPGELTTRQAKRLVDEFAELQVFYVNIGGGEPLLRSDFTELVDYAIGRGVGVNFSTNGTLLNDRIADWVTSTPYLDLQISVDAANPAVNDRLRGRGSFALAAAAMRRLAERGRSFKVSSVVTRLNVGQLDDLLALAKSHGAELRLSRFRPSGRGAALWPDLRLEPTHQVQLYRWLRAHPGVHTGDSFFYLSALGEPLPGMNLCGAGRIICLVDPVGDVYPCPFLADPAFRGGNVLHHGGLTAVWRKSAVFAALRATGAGSRCRACEAFARCAGGCLAAKHFAGVDPRDPDPDCVFGRQGDGVAGRPSLPATAVSMLV